MQRTAGRRNPRLRAKFLTGAALAALLIPVQFAPAMASGPGGVPASFALPGGAAPTYGAAAEIVSYVDLVHRSYEEAYDKAVAMKSAIGALLDKPSESNLAAAREAWIAAHVAYSRTEAFRFYEGPIDFAKNAKGDEGPEGRLNAWPLNEAFIDYVKGNPKAGIVNDLSIPITVKSIRERDQVSDEADVTTGFHAVEFLLWGQDLSAKGPGARPASDYASGDPVRERRRLYLSTVTEMIADDLLWLTAQWDVRNANVYAKNFLAYDQRDALGRILTGMAMLGAVELATERMSVALDSGDQEDEPSCFSDTTHLVYRADQKSISNVYFGEFGDWKGAGLQSLVARVDPELDKLVAAQIRKTSEAVAAIPAPVDRILASPKGSKERATMEKAIAELEAQSMLLVEVGKRLGVAVNIAPE